MAHSAFLRKYPKLLAVVRQIDAHLATAHPDFFSTNNNHPVLAVRRSKVIHDNVWGTNRFSWRELAIIDSPIVQRLRHIHQIGLGYYIYPTARHSRFEHTLGVVTVSTRIFDSLTQRHAGELRAALHVVSGRAEFETDLARLRQEVRLAALLHDTGHSLFSHASESVYRNLDILKGAADELYAIAGKQRGAGEVLSFAFALSTSVKRLMDRAGTRLIGNATSLDYDGSVDMLNVALMIIGRSVHPFLQFAGDIISSAFDADKLDYLIRDSQAAGLPLRYDLEKYLYSVCLEKQFLRDDAGFLKTLYTRSSRTPPTRRTWESHPVYDTYRSRLPRKAINVIEQVMMCKLMLFSYVYHHSKVRAAEGFLEKTLTYLVKLWRDKGLKDSQILDHFLVLTDASIRSPLPHADAALNRNLYRLNNRLLPREVYRLCAADTTHAPAVLLGTYLDELSDAQKRPERIAELERAIGEELVKLDSSLGPDYAKALLEAGVWLDAPRPPRFEELEDILIAMGPGTPDVPLRGIFPIDKWQEAYLSYKYYVRVFSFSEYSALTERAAKVAMERVIHIGDDSFYTCAHRKRE